MTYSSCENEIQLQSDNAFSQEVLEASPEFKEFAYYFTDFLLHAQLAKSDILSEKHQDLKLSSNKIKNSEYLTEEELEVVSSFFGFQDVKEYQIQNEAFNESFFALTEEFPSIFEEKNRAVIASAVAKYFSNINLIHRSEDTNLRNDEPDFTLRLELTQCTFPTVISQEGPGEFACNGWEANNCQEFWNTCVADAQIEYILGAFDPICNQGGNDFWVQWSILFENPPQNQNGVGGYNGLSLLFLVSPSNHPCGLIFNELAYNQAVCINCIEDTTNICCD